MVLTGHNVGVLGRCVQSYTASARGASCKLTHAPIPYIVRFGLRAGARIAKLGASRPVVMITVLTAHGEELSSARYKARSIQGRRTNMLL